MIPLDWVASGATLTARYLAGNKQKICWVISFFNQWVWLAIAYQNKLWGLAPLSFAMMFLAARNFYLWRQEELAGACLHCGRSGT